MSKVSCKLEDLIIYISRGITPKYTEKSDNSCIVLNQKCIRDFSINFNPSRKNDILLKKISDEKFIEQYDVLINSTGVGTLGRVAQFLDNAPNSITVDSHITIVRPNSNKIHPLFFGYLLKSKQNEIESFAQGTTGQTELSRDDLKNMVVEFANNKELQIKHSEFLLNIDDKIQLNTQTNQTLEAIAQAIFKSWFVDFDPVHAKANALADGASDEQATLSAMSVISGKSADELNAMNRQNPEHYQKLWEIANAFPSGFDGEVPLGWESVALSNFGAVICGKTPSKSKAEYYGNDVPFIKIPDMHNKIFVTETTDNLSHIGANSQSTKYIPKGSICVSCIATVGLVVISSENSQTNQQINSIVPKNEFMTEYLYLLLSQKEMSENLKGLASGGSATLNLNTTNFSKIEIIRPCNKIMILFRDRVNSIFEYILSLEKENIILKNVRDELLPKLLSGEIEL